MKRVLLILFSTFTFSFVNGYQPITKESLEKELTKINTQNKSVVPTNVQTSHKQPVRFERVSDEELSKMRSAQKNFDSGFTKWLLIFEEVAGEPPYTLMMKRTAQQNPKEFIPMKALTESQRWGLNLSEQPICTCVSERGFLPGEEVIWRLVSKDKKVFKEITTCPRPLILKNPSGEIIFEAKLQSMSPAMYAISITNVGSDEWYEFISHSGGETLENTIQGPTEMGYMPGVIGMEGGVSRIELRFKKTGAIYKIQLPWGNQLQEYLKGDR